jgi:DNA topoisomerase-1
MTKKSHQSVKKPISKPTEYCFNIISNIDIKKVSSDIKDFINKLYRDNKYDEHFKKDEELPFTVIVSINKKIACIKPRRTNKIISRLESIHNQMKLSDLKLNKNVSLRLPIVFTVEQHKWWDTGENKLKKGQWWTTLEHNGPYFQWIMEPYKPHGAPLVYEGKDYKLTPKEEEVANFYARRITTDETATIEWTKDQVFNRNFWNDFKKYLTPEHKKVFKQFKKINFEKIRKKLIELKDSETVKEKNEKKVLSAEKKHDYGYAIVNGIKEPIANFTIEPASLYLGRGQNKKRGSIKRHILPNEVSINIGKEAKVPKPPKGYKWKKVVHDKNARWIMSWKMPLTGVNKYVYISAEGQFKGISDQGKFEKSRKLDHYIDEIRNKYQKNIYSSNKRQKQLGTVLYLIDHYGIRVGGANDDSTADTFGASTLLVKHTKLNYPDKVTLEFLGKDSILFKKTMIVPKQIFKNLESFVKGKSKNSDLFDLISACDINNYLKSFDKDLSAKVFRTRIASDLMYNTLNKIKIKKSYTQAQKKKSFENANIIIADTLNHQKTVSKKAEEVIKKYKKQLKELKDELKQKKKENRSTLTLKKRIETKKDMIDSKQNLKTIAINTSKQNYIDPRLVVSWCKNNNVDISKIYTTTMQKKFKWAIDTTSPNWDYKNSPLLTGFEKLEPKYEDDCPNDKPKKKIMIEEESSSDEEEEESSSDEDEEESSSDEEEEESSSDEDEEESSSDEEEEESSSDKDINNLLKRYENTLLKYGYSLISLENGRYTIQRVKPVKIIMKLSKTYKDIYDLCVVMIENNLTYLAFLLLEEVCRDCSKNNDMKDVIINSGYKDKIYNLVRNIKI